MLYEIIYETLPYSQYFPQSEDTQNNMDLKNDFIKMITESYDIK